MPKRRSKKTKISTKGLQKAVLAAFGLFVIFVIGQKAVLAVRSSPYFVVKEVFYDPSLEYISSKVINQLKGRSLFEINPKDIHDRIKSLYPRISNLRVVKRYPNQILIIAKQRKPFAQVLVSDQIFTLDRDRTVISAASSVSPELPYITGVQAKSRGVIVGVAMRDRKLDVAFNILSRAAQKRGLSGNLIGQIDVKNLSQIDLYLNNQLKVIIDQDDLDDKLETLVLVLSQVSSTIDEVNYIDLRFKEPIVKKK